MTDTLYARVLRLLDDPPPIVKQSATVAAIVAATLLTLLVPGLEFTDVPVAVGGIVVIAIATVLALILGRTPELLPYAIIIPLIDIIGIGAFRAGTGGVGSLFASIVLLPVVWLAAMDGRRYIVYAGVGTSVALAMPYFFTMSWPQTTQEWLRWFFTPVVFAVAAGIINEIARQSREALRRANRLADDKELMLQRTVEYAAQLQESEAKYRAADRMFRGVWAAVTEQSVIGTDVTGLIDAWNPGATKILGPTAEEAEDKRYIFDFHDPEELEARARELNYPPGETVLNPGFSALVESARLGEAEVREWTYLRDDGTRIPVELSVTKRVDEEGRTRGYLFVATDITKAKEVSRLKDEFVGLISHELRTPLSSILGYLELMRDDDEHPLSPEQLQYLGVAERNANRLLRLVGDLLFTAQVESGKFPLDNRDLALDGIVAASIDTGKVLADAAGVDLRKELPPQPAYVHGDPVRLGQAVDNLISNAIKFTPEDGRIVVTGSVDDDTIRVSVQDDGPGIAPSDLQRLGEAFYQAGPKNQRQQGTGLGLTISHRLMALHGGRLTIESTLGEGATATMIFPRHKA